MVLIFLAKLGANVTFTCRWFKQNVNVDQNRRRKKMKVAKVVVSKKSVVAEKYGVPKNTLSTWIKSSNHQLLQRMR